MSAPIMKIPAPGAPQRRVSPSMWLLIALAAALVVGTVLVQLLTPPDPGAGLPRGSSLSPAPDGTLALFRWLEAENYHPTRVREYPFDKLQLDALVIVEPRAVRFTDEDANDILTFVQNGGMVILASDGADATMPLRRILGFAVTEAKNASPGAITMPLGFTLARPPVRAVMTRSDAIVTPALQNDPHFLPRAANTNGTTIATLQRGLGAVQIMAGDYPLTNAGLPESDHLALMQNLLAAIPPGARIGFDEYHQGQGGGTQIADLALRSPWGWTVIYLALLLLTALVLNGRRFGRPLPPPPTPAPAPAEYARALGDRWRERKQYAFAQAHLAADLKRTVGTPCSLDPTAVDDAFVTALAAARPDLAPECQRLLAALRAPVKHERDLVALAARVDALHTRVSEGIILRA